MKLSLELGFTLHVDYYLREGIKIPEVYLKKGALNPFAINAN